MSINIDQNLREYFRQTLEESKKKHALALSAFAEIYVLDLLERALDTRNIFSTGEQSEVDEPLALILNRAVHAQNTFEKIKLLKNIGDRSLYVSGFFSDSLAAQSVDIDYYVAMGKGAYKFVADLSYTRKSNLGTTDVFEELSHNFTGLVDLIASISEQCHLTDDENLLRLYERWLTTKSKHLEGKLRDEGILPIDTSKGKLH